MVKSLDNKKGSKMSERDKKKIHKTLEEKVGHVLQGCYSQQFNYSN